MRKREKIPRLCITSHVVWRHDSKVECKGQNGTARWDRGVGNIYKFDRSNIEKKGST